MNIIEKSAQRIIDQIDEYLRNKKMACKCVNSDGTLSQKCFGTCNLEREIIEQEIQNRDPLNGFAELILSQVEKRMDVRFSNFRLELQEEYLKTYKKAYREGLEQGISIGRDMSEY